MPHTTTTTTAIILYHAVPVINNQSYKTSSSNHTTVLRPKYSKYSSSCSYNIPNTTVIRNRSSKSSSSSYSSNSLPRNSVLQPHYISSSNTKSSIKRKCSKSSRPEVVVRPDQWTGVGRELRDLADSLGGHQGISKGELTSLSSASRVLQSAIVMSVVSRVYNKIYTLI